MKQTIKAIQLLQQIAQTTKNKEKIQLIKQGKDNDAFLYFLNVGFNPFINTHLKQLPDYKSATEEKYITDYRAFRDFINYAVNNNRSNDLLEKFYFFISRCGKEHSIYSKLITKSLKIGISVKTINKALGYEFIPDTTLMKAYDINKLNENLSFPLYVEEKLDGVRCVVIKENRGLKAYTYNGSPLILHFIFDDIDKLPNGVYDGELLSTNRQKTSGIVNQVINENYKNEAELKFNIFDYIKLDDFYNIGNKNKLWERKQALSFMKFDDKPYLKLVKYNYMKNINQVWDIFHKVKSNNGEGVMLKDIDSLYERKRSKSWIKVKAVNSITLKVVNVVGGQGKYENKIGKLVCQTEDGLLNLNVGSGLKDEDRNQQFEYFINRYVEVEYTDAYYLNNEIIVDFPRFKEIRFDKNNADNIDILNLQTKDNK